MTIAFLDQLLPDQLTYSPATILTYETTIVAKTKDVAEVQASG